MGSFKYFYRCWQYSYTPENVYNLLKNEDNIARRIFVLFRKENFNFNCANSWKIFIGETNDIK